MMPSFGFRGPSGSRPSLQGRPAWLAMGALVLLTFVVGGSLLLRGGSPAAPTPAADDAAAAILQQSDATPGSLGLAEAPGSGTSVAWTIAATVLVLGLLYGSLWALRYVNQQGYLSRETAGILHVQSSLRLGKDQMLHLVQFGGRLLLIGSATGGLTVLAQMPDPAQAPDGTDGGTGGGSGFEHALGAALEEAR